MADNRNTAPSFAGIFVKDSGNWEDTFCTEYNDDGQLILVSKTGFQAEKDGDLPAFGYHYVISAFDTLAATGDPSVPYVRAELHLVPDTEYWHKSCLLSAAGTNGWEDWTEKELRENLNAQDALVNGLSVRFAAQDIPYSLKQYPDGLYDILDCPDITNTINAAASAVPILDAMRGWALDRAQDGLGRTGWDILRQILLGKDAAQAAMERIRNAD